MEDDDEQKVEIEIPIKISLILKTKMDYLSSLKDEIAGWLIGEIKEDYIFLEDILIPKQEVTSASVEIDPSAGPALLKEFKDKCKLILGHWHSHAGMSCFWSSIDEDNITQIMQPRKFFVFIVSSEGKHLLRIESKIPFPMSIDCIKFEIYDKNIEKIHIQLDKEILKKVSKKEFKINEQNESNERIIKEQFKLGDNGRMIKEIDTEKTIDSGFAVELGPNTIGEYEGGILVIKGLDFHTANTIYDKFSEYSPRIGGYSFCDKTVSFTLKKKKAKRLISKIGKLLEFYFPEESDYTHPLT